jgi:serine/threonine protein phosphatase PrpC
MCSEALRETNQGGLESSLIGDSFPLIVVLKVAEEDEHFEYSDEMRVAIGVCDGMGGKSAGYGGQTGGAIAAHTAAQIAQEFLREHEGQLGQNNINSLQEKIDGILTQKALHLPQSRVKSDLTDKKLGTTLAVGIASKPQQEEGTFHLDVAWIGDSRVYLLSSEKGLQQLTNDDLKEPKDAYELIYNDPPMSQYLAASMEPGWKIHWNSFEWEEKGLLIVCTDGCFQYLKSPWEFEILLLDSLAKSSNCDKWKELLMSSYESNKQDDVSLLISPVGFDDKLCFTVLKSLYSRRLEFLKREYIQQDSATPQQLWEKYRLQYEELLNREVPRSIEEEPINREGAATTETTAAEKSQDHLPKTDKLIQQDEGEESFSNEKAEEIVHADQKGDRSITEESINLEGAAATETTTNEKFERDLQQADELIKQGDYDQAYVKLTGLRRDAPDCDKDVKVIGKMALALILKANQSKQELPFGTLFKDYFKEASQWVCKALQIIKDLPDTAPAYIAKSKELITALVQIMDQNFTLDKIGEYSEMKDIDNEIKKICQSVIEKELEFPFAKELLAHILKTEVKKNLIEAIKLYQDQGNKERAARARGEFKKIASGQEYREAMEKIKPLQSGIWSFFGRLGK